METSANAVWTVFTKVCINYKFTHNHGNHLAMSRDVIMWLLADIGPENSRQRRRHSLTRRVYHNKVCE